MSARLQEKAIVNLLTCRTMERAAAATGVSTRTLERWMTQPEFEANYKAAQRMLLDQAANVLRESAQMFIDVIVQAAQDESKEMRLAAAAKGLDLLGIRQLIINDGRAEEFARRMSELEELVVRQDEEAP